MRAKEDRLFNPSGRRHYRRRYARGEVAAGAVIAVGLAAVGGWVAWRGAHPDPELFATAALPNRGKAKLDRGPLPEGLAPEGWAEGPIARFPRDRLYEKINGRAGYYEAFGVESLHFVSLTARDEPSLAIDLELYDLGAAARALGAYAGERAEGVTSTVDPSGLSHLARNALLLTRGRYYARVIGSDEGPRVQAGLQHLGRVLGEGLPKAPLPWAYSLLVGGLGLDPGRVAFHPENAFSFGFARRIYAAGLDGAAEVFVAARPDPASAEGLASQLAAGFLELGEAAGEAGGVRWARDRYLGEVSGARALGSFVVGVRAAPSIEPAVAVLAKLEAALAALAPEVLAAARAEAETPEPTAGGGYEDAEAPPPSPSPPTAEPAADPAELSPVPPDEAPMER